MVNSLALTSTNSLKIFLLGLGNDVSQCETAGAKRTQNIINSMIKSMYVFSPCIFLQKIINKKD